MQSGLTIGLYILIFFTTTSLASAYTNGPKIVLFKKSYNLHLAFMIHWVFIAFSNIGSDYDSYYSLISSMHLGWALNSPERIFNLFCYFCQSLIGNAHVVILLIKTLTLILFYVGFNKMKDEVNLGVSIFAYNILLYLQSFYLLQMTLSIAIIFLSMVLINEHKNFWSIILLVVAGFVHSSAFILIPFYLLYFAFDIRKKKLTGTQIMITGILFIIIMFVYMRIYEYAINNISAFMQYEQYRTVSVETGFGLTNYIISAYLLYIAYLCYQNYENFHISKALFVFAFGALIISLLGYRFAILSRLNKAFFYLYAYGISSYLSYRKKHSSGAYIISSYKSEMIIALIFVGAIGILNFVPYVTSNSASHMNIYRMFWPF